MARLAELAGTGPALEFAVGTGRIALPLAATGLRVDGIELAPAMIERLRAKPGGDALTVTCGDMATTDMPDRYLLVYVVFDSLMNLITQDEQVRCVANAARHLADDGLFVVENVVPDAMGPASPWIPSPCATSDPASGPHGPTRRAAAPGPLGRVVRRTVRRPQPAARHGVRPLVSAAA